MMADNFMAIDVLKALAALGVFAVLFLGSGYAIGCSTNILDFRDHGLLNRFKLAAILSIAVMPILSYLFCLFVGFKCIPVFYGLMALGGYIAFIASSRKKRSGVAGGADDALGTGVFLFACFAWILIGLFCLVDLQTTSGLYPSTTFYDYIKHVAITDSIARTGVPPSNPWFFDGHAVKLFYYYFWFLLAAGVQKCGAFVAGGGFFDARAAVFGGALYTGLAFIAAIPFACRYLVPGADRTSTRIAAVAVILLFVSGLDILPALTANTIALIADKSPPCASVDWWNGDQATGFLAAMLWVPQHVAALIACLVATVILRRVEDGEVNKQIFRPNVCVAALSFASAIGLSIYVAFTFALVWIFWVGLRCLGGQRRGLLPAISAGLLALLLVVPFILQLKHDNLSANPQIQVSPRHFSLLDICWQPGWFHAVHDLLRVLLLPANYFLEFGFFAVAAFYFLRYKRGSGARHSFLLAMLLVSLITASLLRSTVRQNDLGNRSLMPAQLVMLLLGAEMVLLLRPASAGRLPRVVRNRIIATLALGVATTVYDMYLLRFYTTVSDGKQNLAMRQIYCQLKNITRKDAVVEINPDAKVEPPFFGIDPFYGSNAGRQLLVGDKIYATMFGIDWTAIASTYDDAVAMFEKDDLSQAEALARRYRVRALIVKHSDPLWQRITPEQATGKSAPVLANDYVRVYIVP
jgi:hypothetical protein